MQSKVEVRDGVEMASPTVEERLSRFRILQGLSQAQYADIARNAEQRTYRFHQVLYQQGEPADYFYLVERGMVEEVGKDPSGKVVLRRRAEPGSYVGHRSLMDNVPREATATALRDTDLLAIDAADFKGLLAAFPKLKQRLQRTQAVNRLLATPAFRVFSKKQLFHVADLARELEYPAGQIIFRRDEPADALYVIDTGQVVENAAGSISGGQSWPRYLTAGSVFGHHGLLGNAPRRATAQAMTDVRLLRFDADAFQWLCELEPSFRQALTPPDVVGQLRKVPIFARLDKEELKHLAGYVGLAHFPAGEIVYRQGESDPTLYALVRGEAVLRYRDEQGRERPIGFLRPGDAVGETSLFLGYRRDATVEPVVDSDWFYLTKEDLDRFLDQHPQARNKLVLREEVRTRRRLRPFPWMDPDEEFVLRDRRHWFFLITRLAPPGVILFAALVILLPGVANALGFLLLAVGLLWLLWRFIDWTNDYYIVTTKRVAHREKVVLVRERRDETPLNKVQNVNIARGLIGNLLGFGSLIIDTAAAAGVTRVAFDHLTDPDRVQGLIFQQVRRLEAGERSETRRMIREKLEASMGASVQPVIPRPVIPPAAMGPSAKATPPLSPGPGVLKRAIDSTGGRLFWIEKQEDSQVTWRKHWIRLLQRISLPTLSIVFLVLALVFFLSQPEKLWGGIAFLAGLLLLAAGWWWWNWRDWGNDLYIVTNDRIVDTEALPLGLRSRRTEAAFDRIQNVSYDIPNPFATLLDYGTVMIYTAGEVGRLDFTFVRDPKRVQAEIFRRLTAYEAQKGRQSRQERWEELPQWFATYEEMRRS
jgi:CRP-like cAMP-binding protein/membrane protein YdbS with pleckstrin-like domain